MASKNILNDRRYLRNAFEHVQYPDIPGTKALETKMMYPDDVPEEPGLVDVSGSLSTGIIPGAIKQFARASAFTIPRTQWYHGTPRTVVGDLNPSMQQVHRGGTNNMTFFSRHPDVASNYSNMRQGSNIHRVELKPNAKIFDPENTDHANMMRSAFYDEYGIDRGKKAFAQMTDRNYGSMQSESNVANKLYKDNGFDGAYIFEGGDKNLGIINNNVIGNSIGRIDKIKK